MITQRTSCRGFRGKEGRFSLVLSGLCALSKVRSLPAFNTSLADGSSYSWGGAVRQAEIRKIVLHCDCLCERVLDKVKTSEPTSRRRAAPIAFVGLHASLGSSAACLHRAIRGFDHKMFTCCWTRGTGYFRIDAGTFSLVGPAPLDQERTCVSGQVGPSERIVGARVVVLTAFAARVRFAPGRISQGICCRTAMQSWQGA